MTGWHRTIAGAAFDRVDVQRGCVWGGGTGMYVSNPRISNASVLDVVCCVFVCVVWTRRVVVEGRGPV